METIKDLPKDAFLVPYGFIFGQKLQFLTPYGPYTGTYVGTCQRGILVSISGYERLFLIYPDQVVDDLEC